MMHFINKPGAEFQKALTWLNEEQIYAVDTETTGLDPHTDKVLLIQIGNASEQWVFDTYRLRSQIQFVLSYLTNETKVKVLHNAAFDYKMLLGHYGIRLNNIRCTMLAEQLLTKGKVNTNVDEDGKLTKTRVSASLAAVAKKYKNVALDKEERSTFAEMQWGNKFTKEQIEYAGLDTAYLIDILKDQTKLLQSRGMEDLAKLEFAVVSVLGDMSYKGIFLDSSKWLPLEKIAIEKKNKLLAELNTHFQEFIDENTTEDLFGPKVYQINYNSPKQTLPLLRKATGLALKTTDGKYLEDFKSKYPVIAALLLYKQAEKKISTYGTTFLENTHPTTRRIHSNFKQIFADTGRSSSETPNLQNLPRQQEYRTPFCVEDPDNYRMISADFSGKRKYA